MAGPIYRFFLRKMSHALSTRMSSRVSRLILVGLTVFVALVAARCTQPDVPAEELAPAREIAPIPATTVPVTLTYVSYWNTGSIYDVDGELVASFQEAYPYIEVDRRRFTQPGDDYLNASIPPDVIGWEATFMYPLTENRGLFMDIGDLWMQQGWEEVVPEKLRVLSWSNGRYCHLPTHYVWQGFFSNKALFEQYNLTPPETWDEFLQVCAILKQNDVTPIAIGLSPGDEWPAILWFDYLNIRINGLEFRNELMLEGQMHFDDPRVRAVFATWQTLLEGDCFNKDARRRTYHDALVSVVDGEAAITLAGQDSLNILPKARWNEVDLFRFPVIDPDVPLGETPAIVGFAIPANASQPQAAMDFLAYRGSAEAQTHWAAELGPVGGVPARSDVDSAVFTPDMQKAREMFQNTDELGQIIFYTDSPMVYPMFSGRYLLDFFADPGTLDEVLDKLETKRQEIFEE